MDNRFSLKRKNVRALLILSIITAVFLIAGVVLACLIPKVHKVESDAYGNVQDFAIDHESQDVFYGTSQGKIVRIDKDGKQKGVFDLLGEINEKYGEGEAKDDVYVSQIFTLDEFKSVYALLSHGYLYRIEISDGESLNLVDRTKFVGNIEAHATDGDDIYFLSKIGNYCMFYRYDGTAFGEAPKKSGYLYQFGGNDVDSDKVERSYMEISKGVSATSMHVIDDMIYLLTQTGIFRVSTDFSMNNWKDESEEKCESMGVKFEGAGIAKVPTKYFTDPTSEYYGRYFQNDYDGVRGSGYNPKTKTFYTVHRDRTVGTFTLEELEENENEYPVEIEKIDGIILPETPQKDAKSMVYNAEKGVGFIRYENSDLVSKIDFNTSTLSYSAKITHNLSKIDCDAEGKTLIYLYRNLYETQSSEKQVFAFIDIGLASVKAVISTLSIISLSIAVALLIACLIVFLCIRSKRACDYTIDVLKGFIKHKFIYLILTLSASLLIVTCYYPGVASMIQSMFDYTLQKPIMVWNNFANYKEIFQASYAGEAFRNMIIFLITDIIVGIAPPMLFAFALSIMRNKMSERVYKTLMFLPGILPGIAKTLIWKSGIYGKDGVINTLLRALNMAPIKFLDSSAWAMPSLILMGFPFVGAYLVFYGAMLNIPSSCYEAAELEGCGAVKRFFTINIPLIAAQTKYVFITSFIHSVQNFARVYMITNGDWGTQTPINTMYNKMVAGNYGVASAYATVLFLFLAVVTVFNLRAQLKAEKEGAY